MNREDNKLVIREVDESRGLVSEAVCFFCKKNAPDKSNTHLITNSIMRPAINQPGRGRDRNSELYWNISIGKGNTQSRPFIGRGTNVEKLKNVFSTESLGEIINEQEDSYARDYVFCTECERKFSFLESLYTKFSEKKITAKPEIEANKSNGIEVFEAADKFEKQLIYSFVMLNVWRYGIFQFYDARSIAILENVRQSLFQIVGTDEESTKRNLTERDITPFYPIFIGFYKIYDPSKSQIENQLNVTKTFTYSSKDFNYFQLGLYTIIFQEHVSDYFSETQNYFGLEREIKIVDSISVERSVRVTFLGDNIRQTVLSSFIQQVVIAETRNDMITIARYIYAKNNYPISETKISALWEKYRRQVSLINLSKKANVSLVERLIHEQEK